MLQISTNHQNISPLFHSEFIFSELKSVICNFLDNPLDKICFLSINKTLEPSRWAFKSRSANDKESQQSIQKLINEAISTADDYIKIQKQVAIDAEKLIDAAIFEDFAGSNLWNSTIRQLFLNIAKNQFAFDGKLYKLEYDGISKSRISLQALSWINGSAWDAEQIFLIAEKDDLISEQMKAKCEDLDSKGFKQSSWQSDREEKSLLKNES